ncbi:MAG TPA: glycine--tRNA ligase subunit beta, partial [Terriglobales bacterium]|nr:glycine--tRNA ligase subunit beta [Terriglobales bacterium]
YSTPRRLAVLAKGIADNQADVEEQATGPAWKAAFKDGQPATPAIKFAEKWGVPVEKLEKVATAKGEYVSVRVTKKGRTAAEILAELLPAEIAGLYWAKNMYWRAGKPERFVRPLRWMVALLDGEVVPLQVAGIEAGLVSRGHRILGREVHIGEPASYAADLKEAGVFAQPEERLQIIRKALDKACRTIPGARWREDAELLSTVVNLTEFPSVIIGNFDREFLSLPEEVLVTVMRDHQKYFAVEDASGKLAPHFLAVLNTDSDPQGLIRHGNERVLRARFNDARFFWDTDQKIPLRERVPMLKAVTFQKDLGSYHDKTMRVQRLASQICEALNDTEHGSETRATQASVPQKKVVREGIVHKAALLAKTDLTTELVKEFTELQGIVGGLYARVQELDPLLNDEQRQAIAATIYDQYKPESMEDAVPRTVEGAVLSIADKADSIAGMFALGMVPSGSKDPFALRRQANGIVKTIAEHRLSISLLYLVLDSLATYDGSEAATRFKKAADEPDMVARVARLEGESHEAAKKRLANTAGLGTVWEIHGFFRERLEFYLRESQGFAYDVVNAVLAAGVDDIVDAVARARALSQVRPSEDFESIAAAFKRVKNILRQAGEKKVAIAEQFDAALSSDDAERALAKAVKDIAPRVRELAAKSEYEAALAEIAKLRPVVDAFFDKVMVMVEDEKVRANRLALLRSLLNEFSTIADFSEIVTEKK